MQFALQSMTPFCSHLVLLTCPQNAWWISICSAPQNLRSCTDGDQGWLHLNLPWKEAFHHSLTPTGNSHMILQATHSQLKPHLHVTDASVQEAVCPGRMTHPGQEP